MTAPERLGALCRVLLAAGLVLSVAGTASADDRDFFRAGGGGAYVMMLLDVSGSMTWTTDEGAARASADGPDSKLYLAKSAIHEVIQGVNPAVRMGFAHFRQANHEYRNKRWLYKRADSVGDTDLPWFSAVPFPAAGQPIDFGNELILSGGGSTGTSNVRFDQDFIFPTRWSSTANLSWFQKKDLACDSPDIANPSSGLGLTSDQYRIKRMEVYPKLAPEGDRETVMYTRLGGSDYEITLLPLQNGEKPYAPTTVSLPDGSEELRINVRFRVRQVTWVGSSASLENESEEDTVLARAIGPTSGQTVAVPVGVDLSQGFEHGGGGSVGLAKLALSLAVPVGLDLGRGLAVEIARHAVVAQLPSPTATRTPSSTRTPTRTRTPSRTPTITRTPTESRTPTQTRTPSLTRTPTQTRTPSLTRTPTLTRTPSSTPTVTPTPTVTRTPTATPLPGMDCATIEEFGIVEIPMVPFYEEDLSVPPLPLPGVSDYIGYHATSHPEHNFNIGDTWDYPSTEICLNAGRYGGAYHNNDALWEPNHNPTTDGVGAYETFTDPYGRNCANGCLDRGDFVPWDWRPPDGSPGFEYTDRTEISYRLAPNLSVPAESNGGLPDFRIARYFNDTKTGGTAGRIALKDEYNPALRGPGDGARYPPIMARSLTPLGGMLDNFSSWYDDWVQIAQDPVLGDPSFSCMQRFAILLSDGAETCGTDAPREARELRQKGIRTFIIGFGRGVTAGDLDDIADEGGTGSIDTDGDGLPDCLQFNTCQGDPNSIQSGAGVILADNRDQLVAALKGVFNVVELDAATFATAAVPTAETSTQDSIALTSFLPLASSSVWPGTLNHFVQPVPFVVDAQGLFKPDVNTKCSASKTTGCLAWEAGDQLLLQAPDSTEVLTDRRIGEQSTERRVTYTQASVAGVPRTIRPFDYPAGADEFDLWDGFGLNYTPGTPSEAQARTDAEEIIRGTLLPKTVDDPRVPDGSLQIDYVLGDSLHGEPVFLSSPEQFFYLANDLEGNGNSCDDTVNPNRGYRCFFERHQRRRQVLMLNSNDGQIHAFDAGTFDARVVSQQLQGEFDPGTGHEIWAHIPRQMLDHVANLVQQPTEHQIGLDGAMWADDFFIDPEHGGVPTPGEREWRTVLLGGYREGDVGYFALDVTQPDPLDVVTVKNFAGVSVRRFVPRIGANYVPSCNTAYSPSECGPLPYPSVLWEFTDACDGTTACVNDRKDEDGNGHSDLGFTWSKPNTGRVRVLVDGDLETRYVAIFGGGMDPSTPNLRGNFIYMVDVETGETLYKRLLDGSAPSEPSAVDTDQDGFLDTVYLGTTRGFLYKVDISAAANVNLSTGRIDNTTQWAPLKIFDTGDRPMFYPPTVIFVSQLGQYALAFGTGNREDLWMAEVPPEEGRFYMILDYGFDASVPGLPFSESSYQVIAKADGPSSSNLLINPNAGNQAGWVMLLEPDERVTTEAFALEGLLTFNAFSPNDTLEGDTSCSISAGVANIYTLLSTNANALGESGRYRSVGGLASSPYVMPASVSQAGFEGQRTDPFDTSEIQGIRESLKSLYPANCNFGNFALRVAANISNTAQFAVAEVPVCVVVKNWKEF